MDTSSFERLPESIRRLVIDGLDGEVQSGLEHLDEAKKTGALDAEATAAIEGDIRRAAELRNRFSPAK
ncbi:hypothetical protein MUN78_03415 [Leucobacter allii]|uniref:Uncharacterized protein n=1 Tax=Leucobacter allii TaxID=2932247 RepID=A0ABY4FNR3_9MICO|nr:hypothetical protein [Leucobacter allii]UOQ57900.1 hypothetical protein MUN78_03415 [Leucobacter allii]UOR02533.1 hypothetical protein MUN77_04285 [Leucobacter allii]